MPITEGTIHDLATAESYERGENYYQTNSVSEIQQRGDIILARVEGSRIEPYHVAVTVSAHEVVTTSCTCPYDWGGICKHLVAVLLCYVRQPERIETRPSISEVLAGLDGTAARKLLNTLLRQEPHLIDRIETIVRQEHHPPFSPADVPSVSQFSPSSQTIIHPSALRNQVQQLLRDADFDDLQTACNLITDQVLELLTYVRPFLKAGDGRNALLLLRAIIEPVLGRWYEHDHIAAVTRIFREAGPLFGQALQHIKFSAIEQAEWQKRLQKWQDELTDYNIPHVFDNALEAINE
jgi:uncharacterized Zn finger protein